VPWCEECSRFWNPPSLSDRGECPTCGRVIAAPPRAPWHFKVMLVGLVVYLGFRAYQGVVWVVHHVG